MERFDYLLKYKYKTLVLGHGASSQFLLSVVSPLQVFPPFSAFCTISRDIIFVADVPHVALHGPSDQGPNSQSTKTESKILLFRENSLYVLIGFEYKVIYV